MFRAKSGADRGSYPLCISLNSLARRRLSCCRREVASMAKRSGKQPPHERRLQDSVVFQGPSLKRIPLDAPWPWPEPGDVLLRPPVGDEEFVYGLEQWVADDLSRLGFYAGQYRDTGREMVAAWLNGAHRPEAFAYAIGHLYRHAIELQLKAMMARDPAFRAASPAKQAAKMKGHCWDHSGSASRSCTSTSRSPNR